MRARYDPYCCHSMNTMFIRTSSYDNSKCHRKLLFFTEDCELIKVTWCWCIKEQDLQCFLGTYDDVQWEIIRPKKFIYAIAFKLVDELLTSEDDNSIRLLFKQLTLEPFNPEKHCLQRKTIVRDNGYDVESYNYFDNKYAVITCNHEVAWIGLTDVNSEPQVPFECEYFKVV